MGSTGHRAAGTHEVIRAKHACHSKKTLEHHPRRTFNVGMNSILEWQRPALGDPNHVPGRRGEQPVADPRGAAIVVHAADGHGLGCWLWQHPKDAATRGVVVICPATSVQARFYSRFAQYLHDHGFDVVTFDYRGIGGSRPASLRGFKASAIDWGLLDLEAVLGFVREHFPGQPVDVVAHSIGGLVLGLAPSSASYRRVFTVGAQFAYWRDYAPDLRRRMLAKWHLAMPLLTALLGYFPGKALGWLEDTPAGVMSDWCLRGPRFETTCYSACSRLGAEERGQLAAGFARVRAPILALSLSDDAFGTIAAIERLLGYFTAAHRSHLRLDPTHFGAASVGHFRFFDEAFKNTLWPIALAWLRGEDATAEANALVEPQALPSAGWMTRR